MENIKFAVIEREGKYHLKTVMGGESDPWTYERNKNNQKLVYNISIPSVFIYTSGEKVNDALRREIERANKTGAKLDKTLFEQLIEQTIGPVAWLEKK